MRLVAPATKASVLPASYQTAPMAAARDTGTATWSLHDTHAKPARSATRAASRISAPPTARSHACARAGICGTAGSATPKSGMSARYPRALVDVKATRGGSPREHGAVRDHHRLGARLRQLHVAADHEPPACDQRRRAL